MALRIAYAAAIFSLIVGVVMLLNYQQLVTTDPLESEVLKSMVERLREDASNEQLRHEIRQLDLMARNAYFTSQWQIRTGAFLLIGGIIILVAALRKYYSLKASVALPDTARMPLDTELLISRRWIFYTLAPLFGLALIASFLSIDHLAVTYPVAESTPVEDEIPVMQIITRDDAGRAAEATPRTEDDVVSQAAEKTPDAEAALEQETASGIAGAPATRQASAADFMNNFPSFRGPFGLGVAHQKNPPYHWDGASGEKVLWKVAVPLPGYNSPVVWNQQVFLSGANSTSQSIYCYDLNTGRLLWEHKVSDIPRTSDKAIRTTDDTGFAAPTVATDGQHVYAIFATGDLVSLNMEGRRIWGRNMGIPDNHYGHSSSLLLWNDHLFIQFDTNVAGKVLALDARTGELVWETARTSKISWASPILASMGDNYQLVLASSPEVAAYDPDSGRELWKLNCMSGEVGPSPGFYNGVVYAANEYARLIAIRPGNPPVTLWESNEYLPEVASPVVVDGLCFIATSYGVIACFDAGSGELLWEYEANQGFYASPIVAGGKVYFLDMDGIMHIFSVDRGMQLIGTPELGEGSASTPAFANGKILIRGFDHLYCIGN